MQRHSPFAIAIFCLCAGVAGAQGVSQPSEWTGVTTAIGRAGAIQPDGVMKYSLPRSDMNVSLDGVTLKPALALGSWVAFKRIDSSNALVMGDLVLAEAEVSPVISALLQGDVFQTAVHNHLLRESPRVSYVHIMAHGDATKIAAAIRKALDLTATPAAPPVAAASAAIDLDTAVTLGLIANELLLSDHPATRNRSTEVKKRARLTPKNKKATNLVAFSFDEDGLTARRLRRRR